MSFPEDKLILYKTVLCRRWSASGSCSYKDLCDYAHGEEELRRNLNKHYYRALRCKKEDSCQFGDECHFAHNEIEMLFHPDLYKTRVCNYYNGSRDSCSKGDLCSFAHGKDELRSSGWWSKNHKKGDLDNNQKESKNIDSDDNKTTNRKFLRRSEEPGDNQPIRILQHKSTNAFSSSNQGTSSASSPETLNGYRSVSGSSSSPSLSSSSIFGSSSSSSTTSATASILESDGAFNELLSNRKVHILNVVDQIVQATVQRTMEETKGGKKTNGNGLVTLNIDLESASIEELNKVENALKKQLDLVIQAKKKFPRSP